MKGAKIKTKILNNNDYKEIFQPQFYDINIMIAKSINQKNTLVKNPLNINGKGWRF